MTQNLGSTSNPLSMTGEQWVLEERTDDPLSPEPGECWIRTDLNAGDKIATLKFGDGSEVPIFPTGTSEPGVLEVRRVQTGGQTGYLPVAEPDESRFPQFRLQHNNTVYSLHDDIEPSVIPDSGLDHLWWGPNITDISTYPDAEGALDLTANGDPQLGSINSRQAADYDGTDDNHDTNTAVSLGANSAYTAVAVINLTDDGSIQVPVASGWDGAGGGYALRVDYQNSRYGIEHPAVATVFGGTPSSDPEVLVATYDGESAVLDVNGTEVIKTTMDAPGSLNPVTSLGSRGDSSFWTNGAIGAGGHEAASADATRRDELTNLLADEFGITVST